MHLPEKEAVHVGIWVPTRGAGCIMWFITLVFVAVGGAILYFALQMPDVPGTGDVFGSRRTELIVTGAFFAVSPLIGNLMVRTIVGRANRKPRRLLQCGVRGTAEVVSMQETGTTLNNVPQVEFRLKVSVPGSETYEAVVKDYVSVVDLAVLRPGSVVGVLVDPDDPGSMMMWDGEG
jgi:hypothetical protein